MEARLNSIPDRPSRQMFSLYFLMLFDPVRRHSPTVERPRPRFLTTSRCRDVEHDNLGSVKHNYR
ncbi:hypothetical protein EZJ55_13655 [Microcystis aeruginosa EAWAG127a]|uniref:Uncharacterized protein n=1 Tax=Microcystis aeruginosa EAWAG127a TaxID=2529855 RepID=A0A5J5LVP7_MICAE|nr:hypothetical protein [Microcystis aeruginosa]KAB0241455.1 hypothetical protein EZJ55_13655 [Microcystis aeruginosa EAWAG127a]